jgi:hypothetical protein
MYNRRERKRSTLLVASLVYAELASFGAVAPASVHEIFKMRHAVPVGDGPLLLILWGARSNARLDGVSETHIS